QSGTAVTTAPTTATWTWGGASWRFLDAGAPPGDVAAPLAALAAVEVADADGRALVLGDAPTSAQEEIAAGAAGTLQAALVVLPPSGAVAPSLLREVRPQAIAIPCARPPRQALTEIPFEAVRTTANDGTLHYALAAAGVEVAR